MSKEEKELLKAEIADNIKIEVRTSNKWVVRSIWAASLLVAGTVYNAKTTVDEAFNDIKQSKQFNERVEPIIASHTVDIAVIKSRLHLP